MGDKERGRYAHVQQISTMANLPTNPKPKRPGDDQGVAYQDPQERWNVLRLDIPTKFRVIGHAVKKPLFLLPPCLRGFNGILLFSRNSAGVSEIQASGDYGPYGYSSAREDICQTA
jgi:hypothetical protein